MVSTEFASWCPRNSLLPLSPDPFGSLTVVRLTGLGFGPVVLIVGIISFWVPRFRVNTTTPHVLAAEILLANAKARIYINSIYYFGGRS